MKRIAIITGATAGLGNEFLYQVERKYRYQLDEIWAIARDQEKLDILDNVSLVPIKTFAFDLTDMNAYAPFIQALKDEDPVVKLLINNAGTVSFEDFRNIEHTKMQKMHALHCQAILEMCYQTLEYMYKGSRIINVASVAAFMPMPGANVYAADKGFVLNFSRALNFELSKVGISVTAVCPKALDKGNADSKTDFPAREIRMRAFGTEKPQTVVAHALDNSARGKDVSVSSLDVQLLRVITKLLPTKILFKGQEFFGFC